MTHVAAQRQKVVVDSGDGWQIDLYRAAGQHLRDEADQIDVDMRIHFPETINRLACLLEERKRWEERIVGGTESEAEEQMLEDLLRQTAPGAIPRCLEFAERIESQAEVAEPPLAQRMQALQGDLMMCALTEDFCSDDRYDFLCELLDNFTLWQSMLDQRFEADETLEERYRIRQDSLFHGIDQ